MKFSITHEKNQHISAILQVALDFDHAEAILSNVAYMSALQALIQKGREAIKRPEDMCFEQVSLWNQQLLDVAFLKLAEDPKRDLTALSQAKTWFKNLNQNQLYIDLTGLEEARVLQVLSLLMRVINDAVYQFVRCKSKAEETPRLEEVVFVTTVPVAETVLIQNNALTRAMNFMRDLANSPANICTPEFLAKTAKERADAWGVEVKIHNRQAIESIGMGSFLSVAKGSDAAPYFIELHYQGAAADVAPVVLVGKGITFDSGGISLKPGAGMDEMKYDMCGAASVMATFFAAVECRLPINLITLIPTCENMPSGGANKPGDIVESLNGLTIEVLNTDAEGRLILCDALTYAERFKPCAVIDVATLTGACIIALGHEGSGLMSNNDALAAALLQAAQQSSDKVWQLPLWEEYREELKSPFADLANVGSRAAGTITAGMFLSHFAEKYPWAHVDIAGTAWNSGANKGATGRPVPLLFQYLLDVAKD